MAMRQSTAVRPPDIIIGNAVHVRDVSQANEAADHAGACESQRVPEGRVKEVLQHLPAQHSSLNAQRVGADGDGDS